MGLEENCMKNHKSLILVKPNEGPLIENGLCLAIEPMINMGDYNVYTKDDKWTMCTVDGKPSAHFEHSIAFVDNEVKILTV